LKSNIDDMDEAYERKLRKEVRSAARLFLACVAATLFCTGVALAQSGRPDETSRLRRLYDEKRYFELRDAVESRRGRADARMLFFRGAVANVFNRPRTSTKYLNQYIARAGADDEWLAEAYTVLADDFVKTYEYGKAADVYRTLLDRFKHTLKTDEVEDYENSAALYGALRAVPRQRVFVGKSARLNGPSSEAGWKAPVEANGQRIILGLDTGANLSLLAKSVAEKLGVKMLDRSIALGSITSIKVQPRLGFLPAMKLGGVTVRNAVFMVLDDKTLTFPDGFFLQGVIGFPVIEGLREVSFDGDGTVWASRKSSRAGAPNMCLDGKNILFQGEYENRELTFMLDTGAERSVLYVPFLRDFEGEVKDKFSLRTERFTGVGGTEEVPAYVVKDFAVKLSGRDARLPEVRLLTKALNDSGKFYYGNVGGDLLKRFRRVTLDFVSMRVTFR
jgi:predicted aspartyl protease